MVRTVLCHTRQQAEQVQARLAEWLAARGDAALVMAAAAAADGRDALLSAPSIRETAGNHAANDLDRSAVAPADLRAVVSAIARSVEARLREAHALAAADGDRSACSDGAACARRVHDLTGGAAR